MVKYWVMVTNVWSILLISPLFSKTSANLHIWWLFEICGHKKSVKTSFNPNKTIHWQKEFSTNCEKNQKKIKKETKNSRPDYVLRRMSKEGWRGAELIFLLSEFVGLEATVQYNALWFPKFWSALLIGSCWGCACKICHIIC